MKLFYQEAQNAFPSSYSPSAGKPKSVVAQWLTKWPELVIQGFDPINAEDLYQIHARTYVDAVFSLCESNGFGTFDVDVNRSLLHTCGSFLAATSYALDTGDVAVSPTSGFHHAGYDHGGGFCTFNGLALAAKYVSKQGKRTAILDCDQHYGDGTDDILRSIALPGVKHCSMGEFYHQPRDAGDYLAKLVELHDSHWLDGVDVLLYQAGADCHVDDPLGGVLTTKQMRQRDLLVFSMAAARRVPVVWNLAGGYQKPVSKVVELHSNTMAVCLSLYNGIEQCATSQDQQDGQAMGGLSACSEA